MVSQLPDDLSINNFVGLCDCVRVDITAHARTAHHRFRSKDRKRTSADLSIMTPDNPFGQGTEL